MNVSSLAENIIKNQPQSWKDDPFELKGFVTGVTPMRQPYDIDGFMLDLVAQYGKHHRDYVELSVNMLPEDEKNELVRLYIESQDREIEYACYGEDESINSSFLCSLLDMLKNNNFKNRENFAETTRKNLINYYKKQLNDLLDTACETYMQILENEESY